MCNNINLDYALEALDISVEKLDDTIFENSIESIDTAFEGAGLDATKFSIRYRKKFKELKIRKRIAELQLKMGDFKSLRQNISELRDITNELKKMIESNIPEPENGWGSFCAAFSPIFSGMPTEEITGAIMVGDTIITTSKVYEDEYSRATRHLGKKSLQQSMNYFLKQLRDIEEKIAFEENRAKNKEQNMSDSQRKKLELLKKKTIEKIKKYQAKIEKL